MRIKRAAVGLAVVATVVAGCGGGGSSGGASESDGAAGPQAASPTTTARHVQDLSAALLPESALPSGLQVRQIDLSKVSLDRLTKQSRHIEPARCKQLIESSAAALDDPRSAALIAASAQGVVTNFVVPAGNLLATTTQRLDTCSQVTVDMGRLSGTSTIEQIDPPDLDADKVLAYRQTTTFDLPASAPDRLEQSLSQLGTQTTVLIRDSGVLIMVTVVGDPGVTAAELAPKALQQARQALN